MKILITGGTGFIGRHLVAFWERHHYSVTVVARTVDTTLFNETVHCIEADITSKEAIQTFMGSVQPNIVIHTAAMSKPNDCEAAKELCYATNVAATEFLVAACKAVGAKLIFLSTDFVFGDNGPYSEVDSYKPVNYYGESKKRAEEAIRSGSINYAIVRTGLVVGPKLQGQTDTFLHWIKNSLEKGKTVQLYTDQQRSPTFVSDLCWGINTILTNGFTGIVHLSGKEVFSPYSLALQLSIYFGFNQQLLQPVTAAQRPEPARRPQNAVLSIEKAKELLGYSPMSFNEILAAVF